MIARQQLAFRPKYYEVQYELVYGDGAVETRAGGSRMSWSYHWYGTSEPTQTWLVGWQGAGDTVAGNTDTLPFPPVDDIGDNSFRFRGNRTEIEPTAVVGITPADSVFLRPGVPYYWRRKVTQLGWWWDAGSVNPSGGDIVMELAFNRTGDPDAYPRVWVWTEELASTNVARYWGVLGGTGPWRTTLDASRQELPWTQATVAATSGVFSHQMLVENISVNGVAPPYDFVVSDIAGVREYTARAYWRLEFGDGQSFEYDYLTAGSIFPDQSHTYAAVGTYTAHLYLVFAGETPQTVPNTRKSSVTVTVTAPMTKQPAVIDYGGYHSAYSFPNYATSG